MHDDAIEDAKSEGNVETLKGLKDKLKDYRQSGLNKDGEFSYENLVFKYLISPFEFIQALLTPLRPLSYFQSLPYFSQRLGCG